MSRDQCRLPLTLAVRAARQYDAETVFSNETALYESTVPSRGIRFDDGQMMPVWGTLVVLPASVLLGYLSERFVEAPCRELLRVKTAPAKPTESSRLNRK